MLLRKCSRVIKLERMQSLHLIIGNFQSLRNSEAHWKGADWAIHPGWDVEMGKALTWQEGTERWAERLAPRSGALACMHTPPHVFTS